MRINEGNVDRLIRLMIAAGAAYGAVNLDGTPAIALGVVAVIMAVTAAIGFCPLYQIFGLATCPVNR